MKVTTRLTAIGLIAILCIACMENAVAADDNTSAKAAYVLDCKTGRTLFASNENEAMPMASTTKVMTALLALEKGDLNAQVQTSVNAYGIPGTSIYLGLGEIRTLEELLYGLMLASGNDAAVAIAEHIGGSVEEFCLMMTARAASLGAGNTRFANPNGLPAKDHYTTAKDLSLIAAEAMKHPVFREIVSTQRASIPWEGREYMRILKNKNALLSDYEGATGIKTGFTRAAGRCLVFGAKRGDMEIVGVVLNCSDWFSEAARIMDSCFARYTWTEMLSDGEWVGTIPVLKGEEALATVVLKGSLAGPVLDTEMPLMQIEMDQEITAPQPAGTQVGYAVMRVGETILDRKPLVLSGAVQKKPTSLHRVVRNWLMVQ